MDWKSIWKPLGIIAGVFLVFFWLPIDSSRLTCAVIESLALAKWYAQEHVLLCLMNAALPMKTSCFWPAPAVPKSDSCPIKLL